ncbi:hypothetical protein F0562_004396 [Nyssa sinensis]|uniref:Uncharacterized protein n=1 Tax=Nyssa sinensis TaxID=561372 RepID=A0A5J5C238_9ASTE|nr:hypothetical protein F0562_004396 [Nyssa sinensis]
MGIDPVTHKPKNDAILSSDGQSKNAATLSHMAQWESARLEAEARLVRQSKLRSNSLNQLASPEFASTSTSAAKLSAASPVPPTCFDMLKAAWNGGGSVDLESPTSTVSFSENAPPIAATGIGERSIPSIEFVGNSASCEGGLLMKQEGEEDWKAFGNSTHLPENKDGIENSISFSSMECAWNSTETLRTGNEHVNTGTFMEKYFTDLLLNNSGDRSFCKEGGQSDNGSGSDYYEDNKNYWNCILNLDSVLSLKSQVNCSIRQCFKFQLVQSNLHP